MAASASRTLVPSVSRADSACSSVKAPAYTPEPIITGTKREPSSLVHTHTSSGARVRMPASFKVCSTSRPASTP
jgi:hypothetical protein